MEEVPEILREKGHVGFAEIYLKQFDEESKSVDEIDVEIYIKLVELDSRLGTTASEQLKQCLEYTARYFIIKVWIFCSGWKLKNILDSFLRYRLWRSD